MQDDDGLEDSLDEPGLSLALSDGAPAASGPVCAGGAGAAAEVNGATTDNEHGGQGAGAQSKSSFNTSLIAKITFSFILKGKLVYKFSYRNSSSQNEYDPIRLLCKR